MFNPRTVEVLGLDEEEFTSKLNAFIEDMKAQEWKFLWKHCQSDNQEGEAKCFSPLKLKRSSLLAIFSFTACKKGLLFGILALGVFITFRCLDFPDLTVDGSYPLGAAVFAVMIYHGFGAGWAMLAAFFSWSFSRGFHRFFAHFFSYSCSSSGILTMTCLYSINLRIMGRPNISLSENLGHRTIFVILRDWFGSARSLSPPGVFTGLNCGYQALIGLFLEQKSACLLGPQEITKLW